jgi:hypothetical protein
MATILDEWHPGDLLIAALRACGIVLLIGGDRSDPSRSSRRLAGERQIESDSDFSTKLANSPFSQPLTAAVDGHEEAHNANT